MSTPSSGRWNSVPNHPCAKAVVTRTPRMVNPQKMKKCIHPAERSRLSMRNFF